MSNGNENSKNGSSSSTRLVFWVIAIAAVFLIVFVFLDNHAPKPKTVAKTETTIDYADEPYFGKASAPVSIIEFGDYKCPNCKDFNENAIPAIKQELLDNGKAKLYFMNDSFINVDSTRAAKFAESVYAVLGNDTFWKFHDLLYKKQPVGSQYEKMDVYTEKYLEDTLREITTQANVDKVAKNFAAKKSDAAWQKDMDLAEQLNVTGTPTLFVNGKLFDGTTVNDLVNMVDNAAKGKGNE